MYLLNVKTYRLEQYRDGVPYAILSHRWVDGGEFLYEHVTSDMTGAERNANAGYAKVLGACKQSFLDGYGYIWIDTCCIDKGSSAELTEAINSMFKYGLHPPIPRIPALTDNVSPGITNKLKSAMRILQACLTLLTHMLRTNLPPTNGSPEGGRFKN